ncbi:MAG: DNA recombination protein RmuC [Desulfosarcinaceae bacterium]|nr:DNA recombination protein RmuC [Desulfosarcinaceae bacterium]
MVISWELMAAPVLALILGILVGGGITALVLRQRHRSLQQAQRHAAQMAEAGLKQALAAARDELAETRSELAAVGAERERLVVRSAALEEKSARLPVLDRQIEDLRHNQAQLVAQRGELERELTALTVGQEAERRQTAEQIDALRQAREEMKLVFRQLAEEIFTSKSQQLRDGNTAALTPLLAPLQEQLGAFRRRVEEVYDKELRDRTALKVEVDQLKEINQRIGAEALSLTRALKGQSKLRGQWGELILNRILEEAGFTEGREFVTQVSLAGHDGRRLQPDVVVRLPGAKDVVVDAKVSLVAYERYFRSDDAEERAAALQAHLQSVRRHVQALSAKQYSDLAGLRSLDFVLMFIPVEGAFHLVMEAAPELFDEAFERNVVLVSGTTLMVALRTIRHTWRDVQQSRNAQAIAREAGLLYDKFVGFADALETVGKQLDKARHAHRQARDRLVSGRGNLVGRTQRLLDLGVKAKKELPPEMADRPHGIPGDETGDH